MESSLTAELREMSRKIETLAAQRDEAAAALERAKSETDDLRRELAEMRQQLHARDLDIEYLTLSRRLAETPAALADARETVRHLLARVENAISLLKDDAGV